MATDAITHGRPTEDEILAWLREDNAQRLEQLWRAADAVRAERVGDEVHFRGLIEVSNYCVRRCAYCGLSALVPGVARYRMSEDEVLTCARKALAFEYGTVVMQAGEDYGTTTDWLARVVRRIKHETPLAVTLSMGERPYEDLAAWREAGADRYLLRFETSDPRLYRLLRPAYGSDARNRLAVLGELRRLGYEVGSGVMIGIPGQTYESLARDVALFGELDLDMVGVGPYIGHPETPLGTGQVRAPDVGDEQVPNNEEMTYKVLALTRLLCPDANIPATTALATMGGEDARELGLQRGANVAMPNVTPLEYRTKYLIYPGKACMIETAEACALCWRERLARIGRRPGHGPGASRRKALDTD